MLGDVLRSSKSSPVPLPLSSSSVPLSAAVLAFHFLPMTMEVSVVVCVTERERGTCSPLVQQPYENTHHLRFRQGAGFSVGNERCEDKKLNRVLPQHTRFSATLFSNRCGTLK